MDPVYALRLQICLTLCSWSPYRKTGYPFSDVVGSVIVDSANEAERVLCVHVLLGVGDSHVPQQYVVHLSTARNDALKEASTKMVLVDPT